MSQAGRASSAPPTAAGPGASLGLDDTRAHRPHLGQPAPIRHRCWSPPLGDFFAAGPRARRLPLRPTAARPGADAEARRRHRARSTSPPIPPTRTWCSPPPGRRGNIPGRAISRRSPGPAAASTSRSTAARPGRRLAGGGWPAGDLGRISLATTRTAAGLRVYAVVSSETGRRPLALRRRRRDLGAGQRRAGLHQLLRQPGHRGAGRSRYVVYLVGQSIRRCGERRQDLRHRQGRARRRRLSLRLDQSRPARPHRHRQRPGRGGQRRRRRNLVELVQPAHRPVLSSGDATTAFPTGSIPASRTPAPSAPPAARTTAP